MQPKNWIFTVPLRLRSLFRQRQADQELDDELRDHVELKTEEYVSKGMAAQEARRMALLDMGGIEKRKEQCRDTRHVNWLQDLLQDLRYGSRMLRKSSGFTAVAILTLAVGIGANTAIFSVVDAVLLRPLAVQEPSRVVYVSETWRDISPGLSIGNFVEVRTQASSFESLCASNSASFNLATDDMPERVDGEYATASYFATFGVPPMAGRVFTAEEDQPGHDQVVVISERLWRTRLHANPAVVGHLLTINGLPYTVVGIMPASFDPLLSISDLWLPEAFTPQKLADYDSHYLNVIGRLKRGVRAESHRHPPSNRAPDRRQGTRPSRHSALNGAAWQPETCATDATGCRGLRFVDRLRKHCEFAVGALANAPQRNSGASSARRIATAHRSSIAG